MSDNNQSIKVTKKHEKKLEKKLKSLNKNDNLLEELIQNTEIKVKITQNIEVKSSENIQKFNAIIINLPSEATNDELINFLSNRGIAIENLLMNEQKYAILETTDTEILSKITNLLNGKPMENNTEMRASQLLGNQIRLSNFNAKNSVAQKGIIIIKNINVSSKIEDVLSFIKCKEDILKQSSVEVRNQGVTTQMVTIEFRNSKQTDYILKTLNNTELDGYKLCAEYKYTLVDHSKDGNKTNTIIIRNLPLSGDKESVRELLKKFNIPQKNIHIATTYLKKCCFLTFSNIAEATDAYEMMLEGGMEGLRLDVKFVSKINENEFATNKFQITNLPFTVKKEDIEKEFDMVESIKFPLTSTGKSKGCCYLTFSSEEMAALAFDCFQDKVIGGRKVRCVYNKINTAVEEENIKDKNGLKFNNNKLKSVGAAITLFNLPAGVTQKDIIANFSNVTLVNIVKKGESFKGIAEVHFKDSSAASKAMSAPEFSLKGRVIRKELKGGDWRNGTAPKKVKKIVNKEAAVIKTENEPM